MGKVLYLSLLNTSDAVFPYSGVMKKIMLHIAAFSSYGHSVDYIETDGKFIYFNSNERKKILGRFTDKGFLYYNRMIRKAAGFIKKNNLFYDYIYIRHSALDLFGYLSLGVLNKHSSSLYVEFPTYSIPPKNIKNYVKFFFNKHLKRYVNKFIVDCNEKIVYGRPTLIVTNGTDLSKITPRIPTNSDCINVILVAYIQDYHGIDKIIRATRDYLNEDNDRKVCFHIVGDGPKLEFYKDEVSKLNMEDHIVFYGNKSGQELDEIMNKCEIGISSLANKEIGVTFSSTLKSKEYLAKGIPILSDVDLDVFVNNPKFYFYILKRDFNLTELIEFYDSVYLGRDKKNIIEEIRKFADEKCDIFKVLRIIDDDYALSKKED